MTSHHLSRLLCGLVALSIGCADAHEDSQDTGYYPASSGGDEDPSGDDSSEPSDREPEFDGFEDLELFVGAKWQFGWHYDDGAVSQGSVEIELVDEVQAGSVTMYRMAYRESGATYPLGWPEYDYLAVADGVLYVADSASASALEVLFDPYTGDVHSRGFFGYFSNDRDETVYEGSIDNVFVHAGAVVVSEPFNDPMCETIEGIQFCDDESHDYQVHEYFIPGLGLGGFYRSGSSTFSGGGYWDSFSSTMQVGLTYTNVGDGLGQPGGNDGGNDGGDSGGNVEECDWTNDGECDEPEGTGLCAEGSDVADCQADTAYDACPCQAGEKCVQLFENYEPFCAPECGTNDYCPNAGDAEGVCALIPEENAAPEWCVLACSASSDCPSGQVCVPVDGASICQIP